MESELSEFLFSANRQLLADREVSRLQSILDPAKFLYWRPCSVRVLIVVDGLDFSAIGGFGLFTFVRSLFDSPFYVRFDITLAHINDVDVDSPAMMAGEARIARRIKQFKFDDPDHFDFQACDVMFLFGSASSYADRGAGYPTDSLSDAELHEIARFQNNGGGLFATGDHASLGRAMSHKVARARNMRLWQSTPNRLGEDMVSMDQRYRNDTNRAGPSPGSQFTDESDDVPQTISPVFYSRRSGLLRYSYPHPLLCGPNGPIRAMPDHPHEGECCVPSDTSQELDYTAAMGPEYPPATNGGARPLPEIISYNSTIAGTTSGKTPVIGQQFPGICAYDGHRAGIGRVVTDATWHHFLNVNLIGIPALPMTDPKRWGFLASPAGQAAFEEIKTYFRNLAIWLSPDKRISCMQSRLLWHIVRHDRVLEAILTLNHVGIDRAGVGTLALIGQHARDVLGQYASRCQSARLMIDLVGHIPALAEIDPWAPRYEKEQLLLDDEELPLVDLWPILEAALGGALVVISQSFGIPTGASIERLREEEVLEVARKGAEIGFERAQRSMRTTFEKALEQF